MPTLPPYADGAGAPCLAVSFVQVAAGGSPEVVRAGIDVAVEQGCHYGPACAVFYDPRAAGAATTLLLTGAPGPQALALYSTAGGLRPIASAVALPSPVAELDVAVDAQGERFVRVGNAVGQQVILHLDEQDGALHATEALRLDGIPGGAARLRADAGQVTLSYVRGSGDQAELVQQAVLAGGPLPAPVSFAAPGTRQGTWFTVDGSPVQVTAGTFSGRGADPDATGAWLWSGGAAAAPRWRCC
jgi:hypothetical protein